MLAFQELAKQRRDEVRELEFDLAVLNSRSLSPEETITVDPVLQEAVLENKQLSYKVQNEQLKFAKAQSLLARCQVLLNTMSFVADTDTTNTSSCCLNFDRVPKNLIHFTLAFSFPRNGLSVVFN